MDEFAFYNLQQEIKDMFFLNVQHVWVQDQNNCSYPNGQVLFDLASLSNSGKYIDFQQSYLTIPLVIYVSIIGANANGAEKRICRIIKKRISSVNLFFISRTYK